MSGVKDAYVNLRESEKNRIMGAVQRAEGFASELNARVSEANDRLQGEFRQNFANINQRQDRFEQNLSGLHSDLKDLEKRQNHRIRDLNQRMERGFEETGRKIRDLNRHMGKEFARVDRDISNVRQDIQNLDQRVQGQFHAQHHEYLNLIDEQGKLFEQGMQDQNRIFTQAMSEQRQELQGQIKQVADHIRSKEQSDQQAAATWLADVRLILDNIAQNTRHAKFKPGALDQINMEFSLAENNHRNGLHQAAIASAQASYLKAQELRLELVQWEQEWNMYLMQARTSAAEVLAMCDTQQAAQFTIDTAEGSEEVAAEIDYWTEGRLTEFRQKVETENQRLASSTETLTLDALKASIEQSTAWMQESEAITEAAREALIKSQVRQNIALSVEDSFAGTGWVAQESTYRGEDFRSSLHTKFVSPTGDEIVTIVHPEQAPSGEIRNRLEVNFFDKGSDERFRHSRLQEIFAQMREEGIEAGRPQTRKGYETGPGDESVRDFERVKQLLPASPAVQRGKP
jgi:polyisoprenoid-binding protein YceI